MKKITWIIVLIIIIGLYFVHTREETSVVEKMSTEQMEDATAITAGTYTVDTTESEFMWAGQKPFIDGYVNSGTIALSEGVITVTDTTATGSFVLDMNTLHVGLTAQKPGSEGALEGHLKGSRWFDVATYPTATFSIIAVTPTDTDLVYTVTGDLTIKGVTHEISFPAEIYQDEDGLLYAEAKTEIDRTLWGITSGSGNFFENLGDNLIADEVALSFFLVANAK